jgi:repressor LexA
VLGNIAAGVPIEAIEDVETFDLTKTFDPHQHFLLRVKGTSMILDGINDGDLAIVRHTNTAKNGDTVVAVVDGGEVTLKRFKKVKNTITLIPANDQLTPMDYPASRVEIRGVFVGLVRTAVK